MIRPQDCASILAQVGFDDGQPEVMPRLGLVVRQRESHGVEGLDRPPRALPLGSVETFEAGRAERRGLKLQDDLMRFRVPRDRHDAKAALEAAPAGLRSRAETRMSKTGYGSFSDVVVVMMIGGSGVATAITQI